jgi:hypothetical protein
VKQHINKRSFASFSVGAAILIALASFLHGYSNDEIGLMPPFLIVLVAGVSALFLESTLQRQTK